MPEWHYSWRDRAEVPMLTEDEWQQILPAFYEPADRLERYRLTNAARRSGALADIDAVPVLVRYRELTGFTESNALAIWHRRRSLYGPVCTACGRLIRTVRARYCAECGALTPAGIAAGYQKSD